MKIYDDEFIGFETLLPAHVVNSLHLEQTVVDSFIDNDSSDLDEHELAMAA